MARAPHDFWRYSLRVYREDGVQGACLALQDEALADVNLLLLCGWMASRGSSLDQRRLRQAIARVHAWQSEVVAPLRQARRAHKRLAAEVAPAREAAAAMHRRLLALELELEYVEQSLLVELAASWPAPRRALPPGDAAQASLARYLQLLGHGSDQASATRVATLVAAFGQAGAPR
jgi:uncharacterized protein (TIGR02444 family)